MKKIAKALFSYFLHGMLFLIPIAVSIYLVISLFVYVDKLLPFSTPGIGIIVIVLSVTLIGYIGKKFLTESFVHIIDDMVKRIPFINIVYNALKDILSGFVGQNKKFNQPVLIRLNKAENMYKLGFITQQDLSMLEVPKELIAVYMPHSFGFTGNLCITSADNVKPLNIQAVDITKFIVSAGLISISQIDETKNDKDETPKDIDN